MTAVDWNKIREREYEMESLAWVTLSRTQGISAEDIVTLDGLCCAGASRVDTVFIKVGERVEIPQSVVDTLRDHDINILVFSGDFASYRRQLKLTKKYRDETLDEYAHVNQYAYRRGMAVSFDDAEKALMKVIHTFQDNKDCIVTIEGWSQESDFERLHYDIVANDEIKTMLEYFKKLNPKNIIRVTPQYKLL